MSSTLSSLNNTNFDQQTFQPQIKLVSLRLIFPTIESWKHGNKYNFSGEHLRINNILELEKYMIKKQETSVVAKVNLPAVLENKSK
jgi:hypothetical protein